MPLAAAVSRDRGRPVLGQGNEVGCIASIVAGELTYAGLYYGWIPASWAHGFLPVMPVIAVTVAVLVLVSMTTGQEDISEEVSKDAVTTE